MQAQIGTIKKRVNSTSRHFDLYQNYTVELKYQNCSRMQPVLLVHSTFNTFTPNYMLFAGWYYWIDDIISITTDLVEIRAHVDVLATFRDEVFTADNEMFVQYSSNALYKNLEIVDPRMNPDVIGYTKSIDLQDCYDAIDIINGVVVLNIVSYKKDSNDPNPAGVHRLIGSISSFENLLNTYVTTYLNDLTTSGMSTAEILQHKWSGLDSALGCIKSAKWIPIKAGYFEGNSPTQYTGNIGSYAIAGTWYEIPVDIFAIPYTYPQGYKIFDISGFGPFAMYPFLRGSKYSSVALQTPGGLLDISSNLFIHSTSGKAGITVVVDVDGNIQTSVFDWDSKQLIGVTSFCGAVDLIGMVNSAANMQAQVNTQKAKQEGKVAVAIGTVIGAVIGGAIGALASAPTGGTAAPATIAAGVAKGAAIGAGIAGGITGVAATYNNKQAEVENSQESVNNAVSANNVTSLFITDWLSPSSTGNNRIGQLVVKTTMPEMINADTMSYENDFSQIYGYPVYKVLPMSYFIGGGGGSHPGTYVQTSGAIFRSNIPMVCAAEYSQALSTGVYYEG